MRAQNAAHAEGSRGGLVWCGSRPSDSGGKQKVTVASNGSSDDIKQLNHAAPGRRLSAQLGSASRCLVVAG